ASMHAASWASRRAISSLRDGSAIRQRSACASRAESKTASGPAIVGGRAASTKPSGLRRCGPRRIQNSANQAMWPSSHATGLTPASSGTRQASSPASSVRASVVARASRSASASAAPARRRGSATMARLPPCDHRPMRSRPPPRVTIVSPALAGANNGNWHTAARWQRFLAPVANVEVVAIGGEDGGADVLIALHARRAAASVARWRERRPDAPVVVVLTGTDLYRDLPADADARHSLECASRIVVLQEAALGRLDAEAR